MKWFCLLAVVLVAVVECKHTIIGTNVQRPRLYHSTVERSAWMFRKRVENLFYRMPSLPAFHGRVIQGILAYDLTNSDASANVTQGGIGYDYVNLRMKSSRGTKLKFDVYIYA